nr:alpha/beta hydrolase [Halobacillus andaensis]
MVVTHSYSEFNGTGDYFADCFTSIYKVYLVNLREAGHSAKAKEAHQLTLVESILDLEAIRESFSFKYWTFAGHSTGGILGILYSVLFPNRIEQQIIVGAAARDFTYSSPSCIYHQDHPHYQTMQILLEQLRSPDLTSEERKALTKDRTKLSLYHPEKYHTYFNQSITKKISPVRLLVFSRELLIFDITKKLSSCSVKSLIICGEHDVQCPLEFSIEMSEQLPNSTLFSFEHSNHYPFLEEKNRFEEVVTHYLTK